MRITIFALTLSAAAACLAVPAAADPVLCVARVNGTDMPLAYDKEEDGLSANYSLRETIFTAWGRDTCPSYVVMRALTPELSDEQRQPFCLQHDKASDSIIGYDVGDRDAYGRCKARRKAVCQRVNQTRDAALAITGGAARRTFQGVETVNNNAAGAVVMTGTKAMIGQALGSIGGAAAGVASSPAVLAGAAVTVVAVGGAVYACSE
ncbi:hypothetical protein DRW48_06450 [Paracoccus suum]|uniref:Uncharacterized protein n=1 Tax=Paracoccus suum TaxID=2259340 RepID=A0A344PJ24_9RHOB|nr:hypothetical protein [Paracoccus suum]AXC49379.1 hypothetical protein DRW48_06450 [Paracoccus suum]